MESHPPAPTPPPKSTSGINPAPEQPGFKTAPDAPAAPSGRRRFPAPDKAEPSPRNPAPETPPPATRVVSPDEAENDPLVKTVLDVFGGEIKRVHPKNP